MSDNTTAAAKSKINQIRTWIQKVKIMNTYCYNDEIDLTYMISCSTIERTSAILYTPLSVT